MQWVGKMLVPHPPGKVSGASSKPSVPRLEEDPLGLGALTAPGNKASPSPTAQQQMLQLQRLWDQLEVAGEDDATNAFHPHWVAEQTLPIKDALFDGESYGFNTIEIGRTQIRFSNKLSLLQQSSSSGDSSTFSGRVLSMARLSKVVRNVQENQVELQLHSPPPAPEFLASSVSVALMRRDGSMSNLPRSSAVSTSMSLPSTGMVPATATAGTGTGLALAAIDEDLTSSVIFLVPLHKDETEDGLPAPSLNTLAMKISSQLLRASMALVQLQQKRQASKTLTIVHFNDVYHLNPVTSATTGIVGGASRFATALKQMRETGKNVLVLFSGDFMGPSLMSVEMKGRQMVDCFNALGVNYGVFGNHEFDYGLKALKETIHGSSFGNFVYSGSTTNWVMSNMKGSDGQPLGGVKDRALFMWSGVKVGIVGLCENWLSGCSQLRKEEAFYEDLFERGETIARELRAQGAELVIALSHCRLPTDKQITAKCPSIDFLLGGHDHFFKWVPRSSVLKSGEEFQYLSELTIQIPPPGFGNRPASQPQGSDGAAAEGEEIQGHGDTGSQPTARAIGKASRGLRVQLKTHPITASIQPDPAMERIVKRYHAKLEATMGKVVGLTSVPLDPTESSCRFREGLLTGFVCDVMAAETKSDFAILGGAAISGKEIMKANSNITIGDIFGWFPNDTKVMTLVLKGKTVIRMLNVMVRELPHEAPSFPHCSSALSFTINLITFRGTRTSFVEDVCVNRAPIDLEKEYTVALEDFAALGNGKYKFVPLEAVRTVVDSEGAGQLVFWVKNFFAEKKGQKKAADTDASQAVAFGGGVPEEGKERRKSRADGASTGQLSRNNSEHHPPKDTKIRELPRSRSLFLVADDSNAHFPVSEFRPAEFLAKLKPAVLARLNYTNQRLGEEIELQQVARLVRGALKNLLSCEGAKVYLYDAESHSLRQVGGQATAESRLIPIEDESPISVAARDRVVVHAKFAGVNNEYDDDGDSIRSGLATPIMLQERLLGVIYAYNKINSDGDALDFDDFGDDEPAEEPVFSVEDRGLSLLFAKQLATQLHYCVLYQRMHRSETATAALLNVAVDLGRAAREDSINKVVQLVAGCAAAVLGTDRASCFLIDQGEMWTVIPSSNQGELTIRIPIGRGIAGQTALTKEIWNVHNAYQCEHFNPETDRRTGYHTKSILCIPMVTESDEIVGVVQWINKKDDTVFNQADEQLAEEFSFIALACVQNCTELQTLRLGTEGNAVQSMPIHALNRIKMKCGWGTVKKSVRTILTMRERKSVVQSPLSGDHSSSESGALDDGADPMNVSNSGFFRRKVNVWKEAQAYTKVQAAVLDQRRRRQTVAGVAKSGDRVTLLE